MSSIVSAPIYLSVLKCRKMAVAQLNGLFVELDDQTGKALQVERVVINEDRPFKG